MDYSVLLIPIGVPGSGKTTWVNQYKKEHPNGCFVVSTDEIRRELTGTDQCIDPTQTPMIHKEARKRAKEIIDKRLEIFNKIGTWPVVIIDSTNVNKEEWEELKGLGASVMIAKLFNVGPEEAFARIENRERQVPLSAIKWHWEKLVKNKPFITNYFNMVLL